MKKFVLIFASIFLIFSIIGVNVIALNPSYTVSESYRNGIYYKRLCNVKLTGNYAKDIVAVAMSQNGYREGTGSNDVGGESVDGGGNYTEYCNWYGKRVSWCAVFISWCARQAKIPESVIKTNSDAAGTKCNYGEKKYFFNQYIPREGDIIYVDSQNDNISNHVGLVTAVDENYIYTIEGNKSNRVKEVVYYRNTGKQINDRNVKILYYGVPEYNQKNLLGDVNSDGIINSSDALMLLNYCVGKTSLTKSQKERADVNFDGKYNSSDALIMLYLSVAV